MIELDLSKICQYLLEAALEVFSPSNDNYPIIGTQPFNGEIYTEQGGII